MIITSEKNIDDDQDYFCFNNFHHKIITGKLKINTSFFCCSQIERLKKDARIIYRM